MSERPPRVAAPQPTFASNAGSDLDAVTQPGYVAAIDMQLAQTAVAASIDSVFSLKTQELVLETELVRTHSHPKCCWFNTGKLVLNTGE